MAKAIRVKYENGVLKPLDKVELEEGEEVSIIVVRRRKLKQLAGVYSELPDKFIEEALEEVEEGENIS